MQGWYIIRNDLCALQLIEEEEQQQPAFNWVGTVHRAYATSFSSEDRAIKVFEALPVGTVAAIVHFGHVDGSPLEAVEPVDVHIDRVEEHIDRLNSQKEQAVADQEWERAAALRDRADALRAGLHRPAGWE